MGIITDRKIIAANNDTSLELTNPPYYVRNFSGIDTLDITIVKTQAYGQEGADVVNTIVNPRSMEIRGQISAESNQTLQKMRDKIEAVFMPHKEITITHYYGGKTRQIKCYAEKTAKFTDTDVSTVKEYSVSLEAPDPYWKDTGLTKVSIANWIPKFHFPLVIPQIKGIIFGLKSASLIADVYNSSNIEVGMEIRFEASGAVKNPQLFNINTREFIKLINTEMDAGEVIIINTNKREKTVVQVKNGVEKNYIGKIDLAGGGNTFLTLRPGDNLFRYAADEGEGNLQTYIYFQGMDTGV